MTPDEVREKCDAFAAELGIGFTWTSEHNYVDEGEEGFSLRIPPMLRFSAKLDGMKDAETVLFELPLRSDLMELHGEEVLAGFFKSIHRTVNAYRFMDDALRYASEAQLFDELGRRLTGTASELGRARHSLADTQVYSRNFHDRMRSSTSCDRCKELRDASEYMSGLCPVHADRGNT